VFSSLLFFLGSYVLDSYLVLHRLSDVTNVLIFVLVLCLLIEFSFQ